MKNKCRILIIIFFIIVIAGTAGYEAFALLNDVYQYRSPMKDAPPSTGETIGCGLTDRLVIVLLDGLREDTALRSEIMPELSRLRSIGAWASMTSLPPSYSEPGYATILTGAWPNINDGPAFNLEYEEIPTITQETIYTTANKAGLKTAISAYYWFEKMIPQSLVNVSYYTPGDDREADRQVVDAALPWLDDASINLFLIHIDQIDYASHHEGGAISLNWEAAARRSDQLLEEIVAWLDLAETTLLVFSDHGQIDQGGHGGHDSITLHEPFVAAGLGIIPGEYAPIQMVDLAPTIAVLLGTSLPSSAEGKPLVDMLDLTSEQKGEIATSHAAQQEKLIKTYHQALLAGTTDLNDYEQTDSESTITAMQIDYLKIGRVVRAILIGTILGLIIFCGREILFSRWLIMFMGCVIFLCAFHFLFSMITGSPYSFSIITSPDTFILEVVLKTLVTFLIGTVVAGILVKFWQYPPVQLTYMTSVYTAFTMLVTALPAIWYLLLYGPSFDQVLPDIGLLFLSMLSLVQVLTVGLTGTLIIGISAATASLLLRSHKYP